MLLLPCLLVLFLALEGATSWADNLRYIVTFRDGTPVAVQERIVALSGSTILNRLPLVNALVIELPAGQTTSLLASLLSATQRALNFLRSQPVVEDIEVDARIWAKVRQAFNYAVNKEAIVQKIRKQASVTAKGVLPPGMPGYNPDLVSYDYDPRQAEQLLAEAGYPGGKGLPVLDLWYSSNEESAPQELEAYRESLAALGVTVEIRKAANWPAFEKLLVEEKPAMFRLGWHSDIPDPDNFFSPLLVSQSKTNRTLYRNPQVDRLLEEARRETNYARRIKIYREVEKIVVQDAPWISQHHRVLEYLYQPYVQGVEISALGAHYIPMKKIWLQKAADQRVDKRNRAAKEHGRAVRSAYAQKLLLPFAPLLRSLRAKFITVIVIVQLSVMGLVTVVVEHRQQKTILDEARKRAFSLATDLAALSEGYILSYDFVKLEQTVERIAADEDVAYAIVQPYNGTVAAYSGHHEKQGQVLDDPVSRQALLADQPFLQVVPIAEPPGEGYDVAIPVFAPGGTRKWGTVRIGLSLVRVRHEIRKTSQSLFLLGIMAIGLSTGGAVFLAMRLSRPIQQLVTGVNEVAKGNYDHTIAVISHDEVGHLARRFEEMRQALRLHITHLAEEKQRLEGANKTIKETQEQLIQSGKLAAVGKLAAKVAHEVNNPLAIIKTSIHLINKKMPSEDPNKENLDIIEEEIARIARIIRQLLDFARPASEVSTLQVNEVIRKLMKFMEADLASRGIESRLELAADLPVLRTSLDQLKQVLLNLIKNAKEAMPTGGTLRIQTAKCQEGVTISVIDTGVGIPEKHLRSIFEPFFSTKSEGEGMGLGLAVS